MEAILAATPGIQLMTPLDFCPGLSVVRHRTSRVHLPQGHSVGGWAALDIWGYATADGSWKALVQESTANSSVFNYSDECLNCHYPIFNPLSCELLRTVGAHTTWFCHLSGVWMKREMNISIELRGNTAIAFQMDWEIEKSKEAVLTHCGRQWVSKVSKVTTKTWHCADNKPVVALKGISSFISCHCRTEFT